MKYIYFFMKIMIRDQAMQITDIVNIVSLALHLLALALALRLLALLTSLSQTKIHWLASDR